MKNKFEDFAKRYAVNKAGGKDGWKYPEPEYNFQPLYDWAGVENPHPKTIDIPYEDLTPKQLNG